MIIITNKKIFYLIKKESEYNLGLAIKNLINK